MSLEKWVHLCALDCDIQILHDHYNLKGLIIKKIGLINGKSNVLVSSETTPKTRMAKNEVLDYIIPTKCTILYYSILPSLWDLTHISAGRENRTPYRYLFHTATKVAEMISWCAYISSVTQQRLVKHTEACLHGRNSGSGCLIIRKNIDNLEGVHRKKTQTWLEDHEEFTSKERWKELNMQSAFRR